MSIIKEEFEKWRPVLKTVDEKIGSFLTQVQKTKKQHKMKGTLHEKK